MLGATALSSAVPAVAQESASAGGQEGAVATVDRDVIIVTAQRRQEALEDVPMTVTVLSQETLANAGVNSVRDLANVTTGYQLGQGGSVPQPAIRGITTQINGAYENNVAVYIDGLYQTVPAAINVDLPNIANVQVLKGPQGTLYGRNATGGAILIDTIDPGETWRGNAELTYARFDDKRASGYVAGPITDAIGLSLAGYIRRTDGYFKKMSRTEPGEHDGRAFGLEQDAIRAKLRFNLSDSFAATVGYAFTRSDDGRGIHFSPTENVEPIFALPGGETLPQKLGETAFDFNPTVRVKQHEGFLRLELDTGIGQLRSITGYTESRTKTDFDFDGSYLPAFYSTGDIEDRTIQQTLDFTIKAGDSFDLLVGGQYYDIKTTYVEPSRTYIGPAFLGAPYDPTVETPLSSYLLSSDVIFGRKKKAWAIYADGTFYATDRLALTLGGRYSKEKQDVFGISYGPGGEGVGAITFPLTERSSSYSKFTPRASIRYEITPRTSIYASYSKGFKSGEWQATLPTRVEDWAPVDQESIDAFEVGIKSAGRGLRFDLAAFYYDYKNLQVNTTDVRNDPLPRTVTLLQNAPSAEVYGVEANVDWEVVENFNIRAGATWLHARYGDDFFFSGVAVDPEQPGVNVNRDPLKQFQNVSARQDLSGLQMARAPDFAAFFGFDYLIPQGEGGLRFAANAKYTDSYVVTNPSVWGGDTDILDSPGINEEILAGTPYEDRARQQRFRQGSYVLLNASVTWTDPSDSFYLRVWGNNLTDKRYRMHYSGTTTFGTYSPMAEPLTYGVTVGFKFNQDAAPPPPAPLPPPPAPPPPPPQAVCNKGPYIVFFDWDKSDITPEAATILDSAIGAYANCESVPIMLAGYTDRSGSMQYNMGLSERRNASVHSYLTARGIPDGAITSQAFGESNPRVPTADGVRELQNRRVEITYGPGSGT